MDDSIHESKISVKPEVPRVNLILVSHKLPFGSY